MMNLNNISIILIRPQLGENIGAAARVMKNFDITDLRIVNPRDGWPNEKATSMSAGAKDIIENAKIFDSTEDAISDINILYATTARKRGIEKPIFFPSTIHTNRLEADTNSKYGFMFGQENNGLDNKDISFANGILTLPISETYPSLNLAQAIGITCYEIFKNNQHNPESHSNLNLKEDSPQAMDITQSQRSDIISLIKHIEEIMDNSNFYSVAEKKEKMMLNITNMFTRHNFTKQEISTLRGILKI